MSKETTDYTIEEKAAAAAVASLSGSMLISPPGNDAGTSNDGGSSSESSSTSSESASKRCRSPDDSGKLHKKTKRKSREEEDDSASRSTSLKQDPPESEPEKPAAEYPFFFYRDHSKDPDDDPLTPLTPPGRVPNFPAKMHSILSTPELADVVAWSPHGRSWRVLKPREFEIRVIPTYFEHSKFSSFIRQSNGWGFRRITQGKDRNSYYNEMFLRGLPHLCKKMRRPGVSGKPAADPDQEPDFCKIAELCPLPEAYPDDDSIKLECTLKGGPRARMPVHYGALTKTSVPFTLPKPVVAAAVQNPPPIDIEAHQNPQPEKPKNESIPEPSREVTTDLPSYDRSLLLANDILRQQRDHLPLLHFDRSLPNTVDRTTETPTTSAMRHLFAAEHDIRNHISVADRLTTTTTPFAANSQSLLLGRIPCMPLRNQALLNRHDLQDDLSSTAFASHLSAAASHLRSALRHASVLQNNPLSDLDSIEELLLKARR